MGIFSLWLLGWFWKIWRLPSKDKFHNSLTNRAVTDDDSEDYLFLELNP